MKELVYVGPRGKVYRSPRPTSRASLEGIRTDFNLEYGWFEFFHGRVAEEKMWCRDMGVVYLDCHMSDFTSPEPADLHKLVAQIQNQLHFGDVLVHCLHGEDRTGIVIAAFRMLAEGWSLERATQEMFDKGFHRWAYWHWLPALGAL